jgi:hypothetical protein
MNGRLIAICLLMASIVLPASAQEPASMVSEDDLIVVAVDSLTRGQTLPEGMGQARPLVDEDIVVVFLRLVRVKSGFVGAGVGKDGRHLLIDADGVEHEAQIVQANITGASREDLVEVLEGNGIVLVFVVPKASRLSAVRFCYTHWDSPDSERAEPAQIEVNLSSVDEMKPVQK